MTRTIQNHNRRYISVSIAVLLFPAVVSSCLNCRSQGNYHSPPDIHIAIGKADRVDCDYRGQAHLSFKEGYLCIEDPYVEHPSPGDSRKVTITGPVPSGLFRASTIVSGAAPAANATYDYLIYTSYEGKWDDDQDPMFAYNSQTRQLVYLNHPGQYAVSTEAFRKAVLAVTQWECAPPSPRPHPVRIKVTPEGGGPLVGPAPVFIANP